MGGGQQGERELGVAGGVWGGEVDFFVCVGFNNTSTLEGYFVLSLREREKRDRGDEREGQGRKENE